MSILQLDFEGYATNAYNCYKDTKIKWKPPFSDSFLDHCLPILASIKLETRAGKISSEDTFLSLKNEGSITTPNGLMAASNVMQLIRMLYFTKRSHLVSGSQIRDSRLATFTPLMLYAHKLYNDVPYSSWLHDKSIHYFLGTTLDLILEVKKLPDITLDQLIEHRKVALTFKTGVKQGKQEQAYNYKCAIDNINGFPLPRPVIMMMLQLWLAHASVRNTYHSEDGKLQSSMILDPLDWDHVPNAIDEIAPLPILTAKQKVAKVKKEKEDVFPWT